MSFAALALLACLAVNQGDGRWSAAAPLPEPVQELSAAVLHGRIYVAGGFDRTGAPTAVAFRYDPVANQWERVADLPAARHHMPLAAVDDTLYAVGGLAEATFVPENTLWIYRDDQNRWESRAPLPAPRGAAGVGVVSGNLVVVGGWGWGGGWSIRRRSTIPPRIAGATRPRSPRRAITSPRSR